MLETTHFPGFHDKGRTYIQNSYIQNIQNSYWSFNNLHPAALPKMSFRKGYCYHGQRGLEFKPQ